MTNKKEDIKIGFGCYIYQQYLDYKDIKRIAIECERLGFDSIWLKDNFTSSWLNAYFSNKEEREVLKKSTDSPILECWTTLSSLASVTTKIRLGAILVNLHRSPSITAKMVSTLDVITNGRVEFGLSAGWYEREIKSYGLPFPDAPTRLEMLEESLVIIEKMLTEQQASSFNGKHYTIKEAECNPKPIQNPHPPLWVGGGGKKTLQLAAKYADGWNYGLCTYEEYLSKLSILRNCCNATGRNYENIVKALHMVILFVESDNKIASLKNKLYDDNTSNNDHSIDGSGVWKKKADLVIAGTANNIIREISRYVKLGVNYFTIHFADVPDIRSLNLFARYVIPHFRNG
jgi:alkanesulfonate monooxygenase SsuD/methylene tetrahydromethanopterin reductase-like flavin-dependent oxidoreductase (luciferase family)